MAIPSLRENQLGQLRTKYALGLIENTHSLDQYNDFLRNQGEEIPLEELIEKFAAKTLPVRVLDIGCGNARALDELKEKFGDQLHTIGLDLVRQFDVGPDEFIEGDALSVSFPTDCHLIFSFRAAHEIGHAKELLSKIASSLGEGAMALVSFRIAQWTSTQKVFWGTMTPSDESFLVDLPDSWQNCRVVSRVFFDQAHPTVVTGVWVKLQK